MPAARGVKRVASKTSASTASAGPKNKKKRGAIQLEIPSAPKRRGRVLTCGQGDVGQLGLGEDVGETTKFKFVESLGEKVVDVCAGGMHTVVLDTDGKVWTFGCNDEGALGRMTSGDEDEGKPSSVELPRRAVLVSAGDSHTAALLHDGEVYAWGSFRDSHGSMGLVVSGRQGKACRQPTRLPLPEPAVAIASGGDHLAVLTTSGAVYTMGCGEQGQLGRLSQRSASRDTRQGFSALLVPSKVTLKVGASRIWAGYHATFALDANNEKMFAWGLNNYGQLGITGEKRKSALYSPTECDAFRAVGGWRAVACGQHHSLALDHEGRVYAVGRCEYGRLGLGDRAGDAETLEPVPKLQNKKVISIAAGTSNSFAVTDTGEVYAWGMGSEGQLGTGASADAAEPILAAAPAPASAPLRALAVAAGGQHTVLLMGDPNAKREPTPAIEEETEEQTEEKAEDDKEIEEEEKEKPRPSKRTKKASKQDQEEEVSSTSAQANEVATNDKPQKLNGDEKKETPMEVDESENSQDDNSQDTNKMETQSSDDKEAGADADMGAETDADAETATVVNERAEPKDVETSDSRPEDTTDTSSQDTTDSERAPAVGAATEGAAPSDKRPVGAAPSAAELNGGPVAGSA